MSDQPTPPPKNDIDSRIKQARGKGVWSKGGGISAKSGEGYGPAFRVGTELVTAIAVGVGIGLLVDWLFGTKPWFFILFIFLGAAAGILNVFRLVGRYGYAAGYKRDDEAGNDKAGDGEKSEGE